MKRKVMLLCELSASFWRGRGSLQAWGLLALIVALGGSIVWLNVLINNWSKNFYDALGEFNGSLVYQLVKDYCVYILIYIGVFVYQGWFTKLLIIRWRKALTAELTQSWLAKQAFYRMALRGNIDNPDQRIAEDINAFVDKTVSLSVSFLITSAQLMSFVTILWHLSGVQHFTLWGIEVTLRGYLVWVALAYTLIGSVVTHAIGKPLHRLNVQKQRNEANFRASLLRKQDNAEQIALYQAASWEQKQLSRAFEAIVGNWRQLMDRERNLGFFTTGYSRVSLIVPVFAALPLFMAKTITLGGLMQVRSAFGQVHGALSWFIRVYTALIELSASMHRLEQFKREIDACQYPHPAPDVGRELNVGGLTLATPEGTLLMEGIQFSCPPGSWSKLSGRSGLGKSTLLRTLTGVWPWFSGEWQSQQGKTLLLPQKSYLGQGSLAEILCYPGGSDVTDAKLSALLEDVGLGEWQEALHSQRNWESLFSGGQRQRLAFARAILYQPDVLYLDEATSNLDADAAQTMLRLVKQRLPDTTVIAVSHQNEINAHFSHHIDLNTFTLAK
ncbi:ABC transporter ATP-binding protein/permease [Kluyvera ascorbata]|uniref:ABC transporter ATP-binding protein/permease n=1 Tax=Kluyvera ascorbata TaxID=51288 RepID=UPI003569E430